MISPGADDSNIDAVSLIPSCKAIYNIDSIPGVQIVDSAFSIDFPDLPRHTPVSLGKEARASLISSDKLECRGTRQPHMFPKSVSIKKPNHNP